MADEAAEKSAQVCPTCLRARKVFSFKVFSFKVIAGRTREMWTTCPTCTGPQQITSGPE